MTKLAATKVTNELLVKRLRLPNDAVVLKVTPSPEPTHTFVVCYTSKKGYEVTEADVIPLRRPECSLPD